MHQLGPADQPARPACAHRHSQGRAACRVVASPAPYRGRAAQQYRSLRLPCRGAPAPYHRHSTARPCALCSACHANSPACLTSRIAGYRRMQTVVSWACARRGMGAAARCVARHPSSLPLVLKMAAVAIQCLYRDQLASQSTLPVAIHNSVLQYKA